MSDSVKDRISSVVDSAHTTLNNVKEKITEVLEEAANIHQTPTAEAPSAATEIVTGITNGQAIIGGVAKLSPSDSFEKVEEPTSDASSEAVLVHSENLAKQVVDDILATDTPAAPESTQEESNTPKLHVDPPQIVDFTSVPSEVTGTDSSTIQVLPEPHNDLDVRNQEIIAPAVEEAITAPVHVEGSETAPVDETIPTQAHVEAFESAPVSEVLEAVATPAVEAVETASDAVSDAIDKVTEVTEAVPAPVHVEASESAPVSEGVEAVAVPTSETVEGVSDAVDKVSEVTEAVPAPVHVEAFESSPASDVVEADAAPVSEAVEASPAVDAPVNVEVIEAAPVDAPQVEEVVAAPAHVQSVETASEAPVGASQVEEVIAAPTHVGSVEANPEAPVEEVVEAPTHVESGEAAPEAPVGEVIAVPSYVECVEATPEAPVEEVVKAPTHVESVEAAPEAPVEEVIAAPTHVESVEAAPEAPVEEVIAAPTHVESVEAAPEAPVAEVVEAPTHVESVEAAPEAPTDVEGVIAAPVHVESVEAVPEAPVEEVIDAPVHVPATEATPSDQAQEETETVPKDGEEVFAVLKTASQEQTPAEQEPEIESEAKQPTTTSIKMAEAPTFPVPFRSKLVEPFEIGQTLTVKGKTAEDSVRFTVNLHNGSADFSGNDVPLHISIRFDEGKIVFNTFSKGEWGKEERKSNPWKKGDDIDIRIRAHDSKFQIFADQKEIKEYEHRVPLTSITHLTVDGDVILTKVHWGGKYYPVPYESGLTGDGFAPGKVLKINGIPEKKSKRFHINILKKNGDIALHLNPRFDEKVVLRNSLIENAWGNEEREGKIPFEKATGFDLEIHNEEYGFAIIVDGERFASYAHRLDPHELNGLQIGGDVEITGIRLE